LRWISVGKNSNISSTSDTVRKLNAEISRAMMEEITKRFFKKFIIIKINFNAIIGKAKIIKTPPNP